MKNFFSTITSTLPNPNDGNLGIALPPVFHISHFMLQNLRSTKKMLSMGEIDKSEEMFSDEEDSVTEVWHL